MTLSEDRVRCEYVAVVPGNVLSNGPATAQLHSN